MLETLLESKSTTRRSAGGAVASVTAHTALIAAALYATAQAHIEPARSLAAVRPIYFPPPQAPARSSSGPANRKSQHDGHPLIFVDPHLDIRVPDVDVPNNISQQSDFSRTTTGPIGTTGEGNGPVPIDGIYRADQVERQVAFLPGSTPPRYPELLRSSGVEGEVVAVFVVDEAGRAEVDSIRFVRSDNSLFEDAVKQALRHMRFVPAELGGRKVRQLVQMPFVFKLAR